MSDALDATLRGDVGGLSLDVALASDGAPLVLVGPNGAGKTSALLMLLGVLRPRAGRIALAGETLFDAAAGIDVPTEDRRIGYLPQDYGLFPHLSVVANLEFALAGHVRDRRERRAQAMTSLAELEVAHLADRRPHSLSGGERQRIALARALAARPRALLLDEPLAALDVGARRTVRAFLAGYLARLGLPAIVVTHDPADAVALGQRIAILEAGRLVQLGSFEQLRAAPATAFVAEFTAS